MVPISTLSTEEVMRLARATFIQISCQQHIDLSMLNHFFDGHAAQFGLSGKEIKDVELALLLLGSVDKLDNQQFDNASKFLNLCNLLSSNAGNSVQRVVHYFAKALRERIERETGVVTLTGMESKGQLLHPEETRVTLNPALISYSLQQPYSQVSQFAGIQAVVELFASAKKVHFADLAVRSGGHCTLLMQALANQHECPVELLKTTAVGTTSEQKMEEAGARLSCFPETLNLPFAFKAITIENITDLKEDMFELSDGEVVAIFSRIMLRAIKAQPGCLESLLGVLRKLTPCVMVITEFDANHCSPIFMDRFLEALFFYSAFNDCLEVNMDQCDPNRMILEACFGQEIRDIIAAEDDKIMFQHLKIDGWRANLANFGMVEEELSTSSFYQEELVLKNFASGNLCTLYRNGKCLVTGWKGTPILSVSAWRFHQQEQTKKRCTKKYKSC